MSTESKKLQTQLVPTPLGVTGLHGTNAQQGHDARIAHEQREILALCVKALHGHERADVAIAAASRFLED